MASNTFCVPINVREVKIASAANITVRISSYNIDNKITKTLHPYWNPFKHIPELFVGSYKMIVRILKPLILDVFPRHLL